MPEQQLALTSATARKINWREIDVSSIGLGHRAALPEGAVDEPGPSQDRIEKVFSAAQQVFNQAIADLQRMTRVLYWAIGGTITVVIVATLVGQFVENARAGQYSAALSLGGVMALLGVAFKLINAHRDILILRLVPTKYSLGLQLARTDNQRQELFDTFLKDMASLRAGEKLARG